MRFLDRIDKYLYDNEYKIILKNNKIDIINYEEIIDFSPYNISIKCHNKLIIIEGQNLIISKMEDNEVLILGIISNIRIN